MRCVWRGTVEPEWLDYNGHMNDAAYALVFSRSVDAFMETIGLGAADRRATGYTLYTLQVMLHYEKEAKGGTPLAVSLRVLAHDSKRLHLWLEMQDDTGARCAASEQLLISVRQQDGQSRVAAWREVTQTAIATAAQADDGAPWPDRAGQGIALKRRA